MTDTRTPMTAPTVDTPLTAEAIEHNARNLARYHSGEAEYFRAADQASRARVHDGAAETIASLLGALLAARREVEATQSALRAVAKFCWDTVETNGLGEDEYANALLHASALARAAIAAKPDAT